MNRLTPAVRRSVRSSVRLVPAALVLATLLPGSAGDAALVAALVVVPVVVVALAVLAWRRRVSVLEPVLAVAGLLVVLVDGGLAVVGAALLAAALARTPEKMPEKVPEERPEMPGTPVPGRRAPPGR